MKISLLILMLVFSAASVFAQNAKRDDKISAGIRRVMDAQVLAWNAGDVDDFMKGYWNSAQMTFVSGDHVTKGWQPTLDNYKKKYDSKAKMGVLTFSDLEISVLAKDAAVVLGSWSLAREADNPHGKFTLTFRKFKNDWKIIIDHTS